MKSLKKTLVLLVVLSMVLTVVAPVFAFTDKLGNYEDQVNKMVALGVLNGYKEDGTFKAEGNITRAEMAKVICIITGSTQAFADANATIQSKFSDVAAGEWYTGWVNIASGNGIINGFPDGTFRPSENLTTNQALTLIVKALGWGVVVDQSGTWPANYVKKAAELRITKDVVATGSDLANRGNVAIMCWNALEARIWDVNESNGSELTSGRVAGETLLSRYFSDFASEAGDLKLVEDVLVAATPLQDKDFGVNQVKFYGDAESSEADIALYIDAQKSSVSDKENKTYKVDADTVVAYVPTEVYKEIANLYGKRVNVLFGEDNEVALIVVVDDTVNNAYITAFDQADSKVEVDEVEYDLASNVRVSVFGNVVGTGAATLGTVIDALDVTNETRTFDRKVVANIILNEDDEVSSIDLMFSEGYSYKEYVKNNASGTLTVVADAAVPGANQIRVSDTGITVVPGDKVDVSYDLTVEEGIVKSVSSTGIIRKIGGGTFFSGAEIEDVEDTDEPRVIKNGALASLEDIAAGDVLTTVRDAVADEYFMVYVSSNKAEGTISAIKNNNVTIDSNKYYTTKTTVGDTNGDIEDAVAINNNYSLYFDEAVEAYINYFGEVSALVATTDATDATLGVVTRNATIKADDNDVDYISLRIMTSDGTKASYKIYNKTSGKSIDEATEYGNGAGEFDETDLVEGTLVVFSADADSKIKSDDIELAAAGEDYTIDTKELNVIALPDEFAFTALDPVGVGEDGEYFSVNDDDKTITVATFKEDDEDFADGTDPVTYRFSTATVSYNTKTTKLELISGWDALCAADDTHSFAKDSLLAVDSTNRVKYFAGDVASYQSETSNYAVLTDVSLTKNEDGDTVKTATLFVNGKEESYELAVGTELNGIEEGSFIKYTLTDDQISAATAMVKTADLADLDLNAEVDDTIDTSAESATATTEKESLTVREIVDGVIFYTDDVDGETELTELPLEEDGYVIYDLRDGSYKMIESIDDIVDTLAIGFISETDNDVDIIVIVD